MKKAIISSLILIFCISVAHTQQVSTYAGTAQTLGYTSGLNKSSSKFNKPYGLAYDSQGNLWISESGGHVIKMLYPNGLIYARAGAYNQAGFYNASGITSKFNGPSGIAIGPNDEIYVADKDNHVIRKISAFTSIGNTQAVTVFAGKHTAIGLNYTSYPGYANGSAAVAQFQGPTDVAVDGNGNVYVADQGNHVIRKITPSGAVTKFAGQAGQSGNVNGNANTVAKFYSPTGIIYHNGNLYVADLSNSAIRKIDLSTNIVSTVVSSLWTPHDLVILNNDYFISDQHRIRKYDGNSLSTYVGSTQLSTSGYQDGNGTTARFYNIKSIVLNPTDSNLYIADQDNHVIRKAIVCQSFTPNITVNGSTSICSGDSVQLSGPSGYSQYLWSTSDTTQSIYVKTTTSVTLTVKDQDSCIGTSSTVNIIVNPIPTSTFSFNSNSCTGSNDTIIYTGNADASATYTWDFDGATIISGAGQGPYILNWSNTGTKTVSLTVSKNSCQSVQTNANISVFSTPTSGFNISSSTICSDTKDTISYTDSASSSATYNWDFDNAIIVSGSGQGPIVVKWANGGVKNVSLVVAENGCSSTQTTQNVTVNTTPTSSFTASAGICTSANDTITYTGNASSTAIYNWDFDGATIISGSGQGPYILNWSTQGNKNLTLTVTENNCTSSQTSKQINVTTTPDASFTVLTPVCTYDPDTIEYTGSASSSATYNWNFGGAIVVSGSGQGPYIIYWTSGGSKNINLKVSENGCSSTQNSKNVQVNQGPTSIFLTRTKVCQGEHDTINYTGTGSSSATYNWVFSGATIISGSSQGPYILYWGTGGNKNVSLTVSENGCTSTQTDVNVNVIPIPVAIFTADTSICVNADNTITFIGYASTSANFQWDFSAGFIVSGSGEGPYTIRWGGSGTKNVSLIIDDKGCISAKREMDVNVYENPPKPSIFQNGDTLYSSLMIGNQWYNSTGIIASATGDSYHPTKKGNYYVIVTNIHGCSATSDSYYFEPDAIFESSINNNYLVFPNPANEELNIVFKNDFYKNSLANLYNSEGKLVLSKRLVKRSNQIDIHNIKKGIYILKITNNSNIVIMKIVKN